MVACQLSALLEHCLRFWLNLTRSHYLQYAGQYDVKLLNCLSSALFWIPLPKRLFCSDRLCLFCGEDCFFTERKFHFIALTIHPFLRIYKRLIFLRARVEIGIKSICSQQRKAEAYLHRLACQRYLGRQFDNLRFYIMLKKKGEREEHRLVNTGTF